jgi:hypothetical protein
MKTLRVFMPEYKREVADGKKSDDHQGATDA